MANPFSKFWNYLMALFDNKIEENADPKIQIEQAINCLLYTSDAADE